MAKESPLNERFPPVVIDEKSWCNCASASLYCLVSMIATANTTENVASIDSDEETESPVFSEEECSAGKEFDDGDAIYEIEYFNEAFAVKGSFW